MGGWKSEWIENVVRIENILVFHTSSRSQLSNWKIKSTITKNFKFHDQGNQITKSESMELK